MPMHDKFDMEMPIAILDAGTRGGELVKTRILGSGVDSTGTVAVTLWISRSRPTEAVIQPIDDSVKRTERGMNDHGERCEPALAGLTSES